MFAGCLLEVSMTRVLVGTSGWSYSSWRGPFFPTGLPAQRQLEYYASQFETVELNGVFYRTPTTEAVRRWRDETGRHFVFSWKASKFISHWKRLSENSINSLQLLDDRLSILGDKAGPILFQLPPDFAADAGRLGSFLTLLPEHRRYSFEFRHPSWYAPNILRMLADRNIALCISDHHDAPAPGNALLTSSICADMDRAVGTRAVTHVQRSLHGASQSGHGSRVTAPSMSTSTMTKKAPRRWTRWRYSACWPASGLVLMASRRVLHNRKTN
jgi:uncharacterized protein YecE (DUF72 family)